jgi:MFS family permease
MAGPFAASALRLEQNQIFLLAAALSALSWVMAMNFPWPLETVTSAGLRERLSLGLALKSGLLIAAFVGGLFENGLNAISIAQGMYFGLSPREAISVTGVIGLGSFITPAVLGRFTDVFGVRRILMFCLGALVVNMGALFFAHRFVALVWPLAFISGAMGGGLYTIAMTSVAVSFSHAQVLRATALMISVYTIGAFVGPFLGGFVFDVSRAYGVPSLFLILALIAWVTQTYVNCSSTKSASFSKMRI